MSATPETHVPLLNKLTPVRRKNAGPLICRIFCTFLLGVTLPTALLLTFVTQVCAWIILFPLFLARPKIKYLILGGILRFYQALGGIEKLCNRIYLSCLLFESLLVF